MSKFESNRPAKARLSFGARLVALVGLGRLHSAFAILALFLAQSLALHAQPGPANNRVLQLDGTNSFVELPGAVFTNLTAATVEGWVKWEKFRKFSRFFDFGNTWRAMEICNQANTSTLYFSLGRPPFNQQSELRLSLPGLLSTNEWCHIAAITGPGGVRLYFNGVLMVTNAYAGSFSAITNGDHNYLGRSNWRGLAGVGDDEDFDGQMDEVRVWNVERSAEQIRALMDQRLSGGESNLVALWNFDDGTARDVTGRGRDGIFHGQAVTVMAQPALPQVSRVRAGELPPSGAEPVLDLDGKDGYMELPPNIFTGLTEATVEGWVQWRRFNSWPRFFSFGKGANRVGLMAENDTDRIILTLDEQVAPNPWIGVTIPAPNAMSPGEWVHVASVFTTNGATLYVNGAPVGSNQNLLLSRVKANTENFFGCSQGGGSLLNGQLDEVRIWKVARTEVQVREDMFKSVTGREEGLLSLWNFTIVTNSVVKDLGPGGFDGRLFGGARRVMSNRPTVPWSTISVRVTDSKGRSVSNAPVLFTGEAGVKTTFTADASGRYVIRNNLPGRAFSLSVRHQGESISRSNLVLQAAEYRELDLQLVALASLSGRVRSGQGKPLAGVLLRLLAADNFPTGQVVAVSLTHADGAYHFRGIEPGTYRLQAQGAAGFEGYQGGKNIEVTAGPSLTGFDFTLERAALAQTPATAALNRVLATSDGVNRGYVELPPEIFNELDEATVEGWVRWDSFDSELVFYSYGLPKGGLRIKSPGAGPALQADITSNGEAVRSGRWLQSGEWTHVAWVTGKGGMRLYLNGALVSRVANTASFSSLSGGGLHFLGKDVFVGRYAGSRLNGALDEVRVWATARTGEQIRGNMFRRLTGQEEGLAALWNFDDPNEPGRDASPHGFHGKLIDKASAQPVCCRHPKI